MIIFTHHTGEPHGILGAQIAATFLQRRLSIPSIVVGVERNFSRERLLGFVQDYYAKRERIVAFSHLCGRKDLIDLTGELKAQGFFTILGGPQAGEDYAGEPEADLHPNRFSGMRSMIDVAFHGPVDRLGSEDLSRRSAPLEYPWTRKLFLEVDWSNIFTFSDTLKKLDVRVGQVLNAIGCAYACRSRTVNLPPPFDLRDRGIPEWPVRSEGCVFCDVSRDKGFHGLVDPDQLMSQIRSLPEIEGRKIPFELIDEYPIRSLARLLKDTHRDGLPLSQINLVCRVDDINAHAPELTESLEVALDRGIQIMFASIGFESFSDRLLHYFSKGITLEDIVTCVNTLRRLKTRFGSHLLYRRDEGANHGFIHPTPWDDAETTREMNTNIFLYRFSEDILPGHSTPLIIHHASHLGDWIRQIEAASAIRFSRAATWIEWWNPSDA